MSPRAYSCYYCNNPIKEMPGVKGKMTDEMKKKKLTWDHRIPKSKGGKGIDNYVPACFKCNQEKGQLTEEEFLAVLYFRKLRDDSQKLAIQKFQEMFKPTIVSEYEDWTYVWSDKKVLTPKQERMLLSWNAAKIDQPELSLEDYAFLYAIGIEAL